LQPIEKVLEFDTYALGIGGYMRKAALFGAFLVLSVLTVRAADSVIRWRGVVGIIQPGNMVGSGTGAVIGGSLPWITTGGVARANLETGEIEFVVKGLVLAGGNPIGTRADITAVKATLVCDTNGSAGGGNSTLVQTAAVPLSSDGDAHFSGNVGSLPAACSNEADLAFLVRIAEVNGVAVNGPWIAFGAVREN
jgi:hypothetical protein